MSIVRIKKRGAYTPLFFLFDSVCYGLLAQLADHLQQDSLILTGLCKQLQVVAGLFQQTADCDVLGQGGLQVENVTLNALQVNVACASIDSCGELLDISNICELHNHILLQMSIFCLLVMSV